VIVSAALYLSSALGTRLAEAAGLTRCGCSSVCWCRKPMFSAFRWVMPVGHR
jgi:hypothetical protein